MNWRIQKTGLGNYRADKTDNGRFKSVHVVTNLNQLPEKILQEASFEEGELNTTTGRELETMQPRLETFPGLETSESTDPGQRLEIEVTGLETLRSDETSPRRLETLPVSCVPKNILGWSIRRNKRGYWMAYRKINGKLRSIHIGRNLEAAESKIIEWQAKFNNNRPNGPSR